MPIGLGQGDYSGLLSLFVDNLLSAGAGGGGGSGTHAGGGGAGGILINGLGPLAGNGSQLWSGQGGLGYGAGGGAGGLDFAVSNIRQAGGNGANGFVYVEFADAATIPLPNTLALFGIGLVGFGLARSKKA